MISDYRSPLAAGEKFLPCDHLTIEGGSTMGLKFFNDFCHGQIPSQSSDLNHYLVTYYEMNAFSKSFESS